ncbi:MAG TPA: hypothetical protein VM870_01145, partial [Pyrinomonadaceae bacterium]|nr:hypothetical protein [Pyrinomonadaceae bacterium]
LFTGARKMKRINSWRTLVSLILVGHFFLAAFGAEQKDQSKMNTDSSSPATKIRRQIRRFAPTQITADTSRLTPGDQQALAKIIAAARLMDPLYLRQVWSGNVALENKLKADATPAGREKLHYFRINVGPWSRLDENEPFIPGVPAAKPPQGSLYPDDMTKDEFNSWERTLTGDEKARSTGYFYVIRRDDKKRLVAVPYSEEYREFLAPAAAFLREAAGLTTNATLANFLRLRADAFLSNDYYASDVAWMELDSPIEVTIGPYETYEDELFNYKAAFEAYVTLRDEEETAKLAKFGGHLQEIENNLPIEPRYRNPKLGASAPIRVVNEVFASGEGNSGVQTAAYNLPNDERVIKEKGSKRVMLKNVQEAKFKQTLVPLAQIVIAPEQRGLISFEPFFTHILAHELVHGLGPHNITPGGEETTVRLRLKELYSAIEEAKADITGLYALQYLIDRGVVDRSLERPMYVTYLASAFRTVRFGIGEAHGKGQALQFNYLSDAGAINYDERSGTFRVNEAKIKEAVRDLTREILTLQAEGSYDRAKAMLDRYGVIRPAMQQALARCAEVPVDIEPIFPLAQK